MDDALIDARLDFLRGCERLKDVLRSGHTSGGRRESTAEHSWRLALMAMVLMPYAISEVVAIVIWKFMLDPGIGSVAKALLALGLPGAMAAWSAPTFSAWASAWATSRW